MGYSFDYMTFPDCSLEELKSKIEEAVEKAREEAEEEAEEEEEEYEEGYTGTFAELDGLQFIEKPFETIEAVDAAWEEGKGPFEANSWNKDAPVVIKVLSGDDGKPCWYVGGWFSY